jgi:Zn-dependent protease
VSRGFRLGSVRGVDVIADLSLFIIAALLTWSLYTDLGRAFPGSGSDAVLLASVAGGVLFFVSVFLHELSHSLVALQRGLNVRRIRLFIFGGVSEIEEEAATPSDELAVTLAGPAASLVLGVVFLAMGWPLATALPLLARISLILGIANLSIAVFNLLPGLPLDGGRMLRALVWRRSGDRARATRLAVNTGRVLGGGLIAGGVGLAFALGDIYALWFAAVGWFLYEAASTSAVQEEFVARIEGLTVGDVMRRTDLAIDGEATVAAALELHGWGDKLRAMPVAVAGRVVGILGTGEVTKVDATQRNGTLVRDAMTVIGPADVVASDVGLRRALVPDAAAAGVLVVIEDGEVVGLLTAEEMRAIFADLRSKRSR